ncbi:MAG: DUF2505 domain-containing protein, partial [Actinomycetaceae bacterium]|nr:DUF2505 domain-containing protein [Actinomycetaceae bacterium]
VKEFQFSASPDRIATILLSKELADKRMSMLKISDYTHTCSDTDAHTEAKMSSDKLPSIAQKVVKNGVHISIDTKREGNTISYAFDAHGLPVKLSLHEELSGSDTTSLSLKAHFSINVPLVGASIEKKAAPYVDKVLAQDIAFIKELI